jgi:DNA-binding Lrp family transcriptional regulator
VTNLPEAFGRTGGNEIAPNRGTVANALAEAEIASEIYSTAGHYDLLVKFYVENDTDISHFVNEKVQALPGIQDTHTIITFKAFGGG